MANYSYLNHLIPPSGDLAVDAQKLVFASAVAGGFLFAGHYFGSRLKTAEGVQDAVVPPKRITPFALIDLLIESFIKYNDSVMGKKNRRHVPFVATIFFFIFALNVLSLVPGMPVSTTTVWLNVAMALVVFIHFNFHGIKTHGFLGYMKHFWGPVALLGPFLLAAELLSLFIRILTLNLRLFWNITADHLVLSTFVDLLPLFLAAPFYFLGLFVSFMQAFIFTTLTMIYILLATEHEEHH